MSFQRSLLAYFAAVLLALSPALEAAAQTLPSRHSPVPDDIRRIVDRGELIVALPANDSPPFFYTKNGETVGIDVDVARGLAQELKVKLRLHRRAKSFNEVVEVVARGEADLAVCKLSRTLTRAKSVRFSDPYLNLRHVLALNRARFAEMARGRDLASAVRDLRGTVGVIANSSYADFARANFPHAKVVGFSSWDDVVKALRNGEITAAYRDEFEIKRLLKSDPRLSLLLRTVTFTDTDDSLGIAVMHDSHQLLGLVNLYLAQRPNKLTVDKILKLTEGH